MITFAKNKFAVESKAPTSKGSGSFGHIGFGVIAPPEHEEFHHFMGGGFVGMLLFILLVVEESEHGGRFGNAAQQVTEFPKCVASSLYEGFQKQKTVQSRRRLIEPYGLTPR